MKTPAAPPPFAALDSCHQEIQLHLALLHQLYEHIETHPPTDETRQQALKIAEFFSTVARQHHADEEEQLFPGMLAHGSAQRVAQIRNLIEDHFWIEKYSHDLCPLLFALGQSTQSADYKELIHVAHLFFELLQHHIEVEESMIYPQAKAELKAH